ncbi:MAG: hypothetical protein Tsb002_19800 [Wenzhouxiangellaceae bacterium]
MEDAVGDPVSVLIDSRLLISGLSVNLEVYYPAKYSYIFLPLPWRERVGDRGIYKPALAMLDQVNLYELSF